MQVISNNPVLEPALRMHRGVMFISDCMVQKIWQDRRQHIHLDSELVGPPHSAPNDERRETDVNRRLSEPVSMHPFIPCSGGHHAPS
jgi:hypothetical protein